MACWLVWQGGDLMDAIAKDTVGDLRWDCNGASLAIDVVRGLCHLHSKNVVSAQGLADVACCGGTSEARGTSAFIETLLRCLRIPHRV